MSATERRARVQESHFVAAPSLGPLAARNDPSTETNRGDRTRPLDPTGPFVLARLYVRWGALGAAKRGLKAT